jgi:endonuclease III
MAPRRPDPTKSPYFPQEPVPTKTGKTRKTRSSSQKPPAARITKSPYFPPQKKPASCLPFPPKHAPSFGLIQEKLAHDPFRLLIATVFLNRTRGEVAIPVLYSVFARYPTIRDLAEADVEDLVELIRNLGFQNARARKCIAIAQLWLTVPPCVGKRYRRLHYPKKSDGLDIKAGEAIDDADPHVAWEIAHLPGLGAYAIDSWRIFCRDALRGVASDWNGADVAEENFSPEWKRVLPKDKELRAFLSWMWLKEGWIWNQETGERTPLAKNRKIRCAARRGGVLIPEADGSWALVTVPEKVQTPPEPQQPMRVMKTWLS